MDLKAHFRKAAAHHETMAAYHEKLSKGHATLADHHDELAEAHKACMGKADVGFDHRDGHTINTALATEHRGLGDQHSKLSKRHMAHAEHLHKMEAAGAGDSKADSTLDLAKSVFDGLFPDDAYVAKFGAGGETSRDDTGL